MTGKAATSTADRLWPRVDKNAPGGCWIWSGCTHRGYGQIRHNSNTRYVHRVAYELLVGPIPEGMQLDHICRVPRCCNPDHLRVVTNQQNQENKVVQRNSKTGVRGVTWRADARKYRVVVQHDGKNNYSGGYHDTLESAEAAAIALRNRLHTHNTPDQETKP